MFPENGKSPPKRVAVLVKCKSQKNCTKLVIVLNITNNMHGIDDIKASVPAVQKETTLEH